MKLKVTIYHCSYDWKRGEQGYEEQFSTVSKDKAMSWYGDIRRQMTADWKDEVDVVCDEVNRVGFVSCEYYANGYYDDFHSSVLVETDVDEFVDLDALFADAQSDGRKKVIEFMTHNDSLSSRIPKKEWLDLEDDICEFAKTIIASLFKEEK